MTSPQATAPQAQAATPQAQTLITPIAFVAKHFPEKPPQHAYALLKQGMPHIKQPKMVMNKVTKQLEPKEDGETRPMVDDDVAWAWWLDFVATQTPRQSKQIASGACAAAGTSVQSTTLENGHATRHTRKGQLLTYQRVPGLATVAQIRKGDSTLVHVSTIHGDEAINGINKTYTYPFLPDSLKESIRKRKIILDYPRRVIEYAIESLLALPLQEDDIQLAEALTQALRSYPYRPVQTVASAATATSDDDDDIPNPEPVSLLTQIEKQLEFEEGEEITDEI
jgi:hypothetical protein